jgi:hypothetical protein
MDMNIADDANTESVISVHYKVDRLNGWLAFEHIESKDKTQLNDIEALLQRLQIVSSYLCVFWSTSSMTIAKLYFLRKRINGSVSRLYGTFSPIPKD